jgi:hypothetical protein
MWLPIVIGHLLGRPVPVLEKGELDCEDGWPRDPDVGVTPVPELGVPPHVLVADVVTADPGGVAVNDHDLTVIAEVDLKAVAGAFSGVEVEDLDAGVAELFEIALGQAAASDLVVQEIYSDTGTGSLEQGRLELAAELVIMDDEELDQDVFLRLGDSFENAGERRIAVHQELDLVAAQKWDLRQVLPGPGGRRQPPPRE